MTFDCNSIIYLQISNIILIVIVNVADCEILKKKNFVFIMANMVKFEMLSVSEALTIFFRFVFLKLATVRGYSAPNFDFLQDASIFIHRMHLFTEPRLHYICYLRFYFLHIQLYIPYYTT